MTDSTPYLTFDVKLGIKIPSFNKEWEDYNKEEQIVIIQEWENERSKIPERIKQIEDEIMLTQEKMYEMTFEEYCKVHERIVEMAGTINDLNIWFRTHGFLTE